MAEIVRMFPKSQIKQLFVDGNELMLGDYQQLYEEPLIAGDGALNGEPRGYVNVHDDDCTDTDHLHVVWQRGDKELRKSIVATQVAERIEALASLPHLYVL
jgi:hypothetical protein